MARRRRQVGCIWLIARVVRTARRGCLPVELQERICDVRRQTGWGPRLVAGATGFAHSTVWKVLKRHGISRRPRAARSPQPLRVALPGRPAAHGRLATRASCGPATASPATARSAPAAGCDPRPGSATTTRTRSSTTTPGWPTSSSTTDEKAATVTAFVERALAFFASHGITAKRLMTDNALTTQQPLTARAARPSRRPPPDHPALPAPHQRQGRTLPPDHGPRMGLRPHLPLTSTPPAALPHWLTTTTDTTTQRNRRPTTHQPRSQRPWVGQLATCPRNLPAPDLSRPNSPR